MLPVLGEGIKNLIRLSLARVGRQRLSEEYRELEEFKDDGS